VRSSSFSARRRGPLAALLLAALTAAGCEGRAPRAERTQAGEAAEAPADASGSSKPRSSGRAAVAELDLTRGVPEGRGASLLGGSSHRSHVDLVRTLRALVAPDSSAGSGVKGVLVELGLAHIGLARAEEIGALLGAIRKQKPVVCHADEYGNATMMLAALGCSKIYVSPAGGVDTVGIAMQLLFANRLLEKLHVGVDFLQVGKFKGAEEPYTRNSPSPEARESLEGTLRGLRAAWIAHVAQGRGNLSAADAVEDGPYGAADAQAKGLVDAVGYLDDAREEAKKLAGVDRVVTRFGGSQDAGGRGLVGILRALAGSSHGGSPHVAVLPAVGPITMTATTSLLGASDGITEHELGRLVTSLTKDSSVKAVVLRIDSPGGSALASDLLWKRLRKLAAVKPLVVSVGDMAASGGYYLACAGTKIIAEPTSIVGSIGVVGGKLALGKTLEEIGVHAETISVAPDPVKAARAGYNSRFSPWDDPTRERVRASMKSIYDLFLQRVSEGRGKPVEVVGAFAEGRIFGGVEAKERGMVDGIGGLSEAIDLALQLAEMPKDTPVEIVDEEGGLLGLLEETEAAAGGEPAARGPLDAARVESAARRLARDAVLGEDWAAVVPGGEAFVGSLAPLLSGERALAAMPAGIVVR
jgi:protease-4